MVVNSNNYQNSHPRAPHQSNGGGIHNHGYLGEVAPGGRYVPHVVTVSLDDGFDAEEGIAREEGGGSGLSRAAAAAALSRRRPRLGQLLEASPLDGAKASGVTCVKFSPSAEYCLLGYGVRETASRNGGSSRNNAGNGGGEDDGDEDQHYHPVTALYRVRGGLTHVGTMTSGDDDVNIARFHPESGYGFVYGTKQGRVRLLGPRPWNYYYC